jgi:glutaminyl-tRNA synthetase
MITEKNESANFLRNLIAEEQAAGQHQRIVTRFPPEPNGYPHIGHAKSICLNFGLAQEFGGVCHLRMDDTNPLKEEQSYVDAIIRDVRWLGFDWGPHFYNASDYFQACYDHAEQLILEGKAYVESLSEEEIRDYRGTIDTHGRPSVYRNRSIEENLTLFRQMRDGVFPDGAHVLRAKADLSSANMKMRDPLLFRIRHAHHHQTGDAWCIYPMYDYAHPISDAIEGITHSICTLEFENNRDIYDWVIDNCKPKAKIHFQTRPRQFEFARLSLTYTVVSKRKLIRLVKENHVRGWDDPRMPTLAGLRRRGVPPEALRLFCDRIGVAKANSTVEIETLEATIRDDLNTRCPRMFGVLRPLKVILDTWPADHVEELEAPCWPPEFGKQESRHIPFTREIFIDRDDFSEAPPKGWKRLSPGGEVRLRHGYIIRCNEVLKDENGNITALRCSHDPDTRSGAGSDRKVAGTLHWVSASAGIPAEVRLYERLFSHPAPDAGDEDFLTYVNPNSLEIVQAILEPALAKAEVGSRFQLERLGYFSVDEDSGAQPVLNRIVGLRDSWAKATEKPAPKATEKAADKAAEKPMVKALRHPRAPEQQALFDTLTAAGISLEDADVLIGDAELRDFYQAACGHSSNPRSIAAWCVNEVRRLAKEQGISRFSPAGLAALVTRIDDGCLSGRNAKDLLLEVLNGADVDQLITSRGLTQVADTAAIDAWIQAVLDVSPTQLASYKAGKTNLLGYFVGQVMKKSGGATNASLVQERIKALIG